MTLSRDITKWVKKTKLSQDTVLRKAGFDAFSGVVKRSPVRTGRFRASNRISINRVDSSVEPEREEVIGSAPIQSLDDAEASRANAVLATAKFGDTLHITNSLIYAKPLEGGSSGQTNNQPDGIYGATFAELTANLDKAIREARAS